jgi:hypothetical protein
MVESERRRLWYLQRIVENSHSRVQCKILQQQSERDSLGCFASQSKSFSSGFSNSRIMKLLEFPFERLRGKMDSQILPSTSPLCAVGKR